MKKAIMTITLVALGYAGAQAWKRAQRTEAQRAIEMMQANWQAGIYPDNLDTIPEGGTRMIKFPDEKPGLLRACRWAFLLYVPALTIAPFVAPLVYWTCYQEISGGNLKRKGNEK